jgi:hypothetical protein
MLRRHRWQHLAEYVTLRFAQSNPWPWALWVALLLLQMSLALRTDQSTMATSRLQ